MNGKGAWNGCDAVLALGEGKALEGVHRRERPGGVARATPRGSNPVNLKVVSEMQQAHGAKGGGTRQGGEKPRRRNVLDGWHHPAEADPGPWEWTPLADATERRSLKNPVEGARHRAGRHEMRLR